MTKVIDGDTIDCLVDLGFNIFSQERFRLYGIDTPEKTSKIVEVRELAIKASNYVKDNIEGRTVFIDSVGKDKYGRWLAKVYISVGTHSINEQLINLGMAKPYLGENKDTLNWV